MKQTKLIKRPRSNPKKRLIQQQRAPSPQKVMSPPPLSPIRESLIVQIDCGNGNVAQIKTKPADDPVELAKNFCKLYGYQ